MKKWLNFKQAIATSLIKVENEVDKNIQGVTNDSRKVSEGFIFVAIKGALVDGHDYVQQAIRQGAQVIIYQDCIMGLPDDVVAVNVSDSYLAYALCCECFFDFPANSLKVIGITGTNGKTSSAYITKLLLEAAGKKVGLISTVEYIIGHKSIPAARTTPEAYTLQELFAEMREADCEYVVMEVSSHALEQSRIGAVRFAVGLFTNLSGDHLDYHGTMDNYFAAKKKLFDCYLLKDGFSVINIDDEYGNLLASEENRGTVLTFGKDEQADFHVVEINDSIEKSHISLKVYDKLHQFSTNLIGSHNAYNIIGAIAIANGLGIALKDILFTIGDVQFAIPGRLEAFDLQNGGRIFVDYAHTDDALENVLNTLRPLTRGRLITLFGCGGDRDTTKRSRMGRVAEKYSDIIILTNDNPRSEDPLSIIRGIAAGIKSKTPEIYPDRREAIKHAIMFAQKDDVVLIAGKGHEEYQEINNTFHDFSDRKEVECLLKESL